MPNQSCLDAGLVSFTLSNLIRSPSLKVPSVSIQFTQFRISFFRFWVTEGKAVICISMGGTWNFSLLKHFHLLSSTTRRKIPAGSKGAAMRGGFIRPCVFILLVFEHTWTFSKDPNERMSTISNKTCDKLFKMFACATEYCCLSWKKQH